MLIKESAGANSIYLNINKEGKLYRKNKEGVVETYASVKGVIKNIEFHFDENFKREKAKILIAGAENESYILQMNTDSGYFRAFCNSLKSGNPQKEVTITPSSKIQENGNPQTTCFVLQDGKYLKHYFTRNFNGEGKDVLPELKKIEFKGETKYDNTEQLKYWKGWLVSQINTKKDEKVIDEEDDSVDLFPEDLPF